MKKSNQAITHESFPKFVTRLEQAGTRLNGRRIGRSLAIWINMLISSILALLVVCILYNDTNPEEMAIPEAFSHIPNFFHESAQWALGLFPEDMNMWICLVILLCAIPVSGLLTGLFFRWIPFKGRAVKAEDADTPMERTDNAITLAGRVHYKYSQVTECFTTGICVTTIVVGVAVLALPIVSVCLASIEAQLSWYLVLIGVLIMLIRMFFFLAIALCILCFAVFWLAMAQEWVTSLFYRGNDFWKEKKQLEEYRKLLEQEEANEHKAWVAKTEAEAVEQLISGKVAAALKTLEQIAGEARDEYYIKQMAEALVEDNPDVCTWSEWLDRDENRINSEALRAFLRERQAESRQKLLELAEKEYPKALEFLEKGDYESASELLVAADTIDYRDGTALLGLAECRAGRANSLDIKRLEHGIEKGLETEKFEVQCRTALDAAKEELRRRREQQAKAKQAEEAYWLEKGRQSLRTCKHMVNGYCCRYCTLDNFPHKCYYLDRPDDMWMCSDRQS